MVEIKAVIFDLDGVLCFTDKYHLEAWKRLAKAHGLSLPPDFSLLTKGVGRRESLDILLGSESNNYTESEKEEMAREKNAIYCSLIDSMSSSDLAPGALDVLKYLQEKEIKIALGSSSRNAQTIIKKLGIEKEFDKKAIPLGSTAEASPMFAEGEEDPSYIYAKQLISSGMPVLYCKMNPGTESIDVATAYAFLETIYDEISDVGSFDIKYITSGGYPTFEYKGNKIANAMINCASKRGDCVALIDHTNNPDRTLTGDDSVYKTIANSNLKSDYAAMFTPYATYGGTSLPASFGYLITLAVSMRTNPSWLAVAGVNRGIVSGLSQVLTTDTLTNAIANSYQPTTSQQGGVAINPITFIRPYGQTIWGNRTLKAVGDGLTATNFLNLRNLINDVKKVARTAAMSCMFEQNTDILWINFKSKITPTLDKMLTGYGLSNYKIVKNKEASEKFKLVANIKLYPIYAVEEFDITVSFEEEDVTVE